MVDLKDFVGLVVNVSVKGLVVPIKTVNVEFIAQGSRWFGPGCVGLVELVGEKVRTPM